MNALNGDFHSEMNLVVYQLKGVQSVERDAQQTDNRRYGQADGWTDSAWRLAAIDHDPNTAFICGTPMSALMAIIFDGCQRSIYKIGSGMLHYVVIQFN